MCGCADVRMCGCADVRMCGCADVRMRRCADMKMCGYEDVRMCGCVNVLISVSIASIVVRSCCFTLKQKSPFFWWDDFFRYDFVPVS